MAGWFKSRQDVNYVEQPQAVYQDQEEPEEGEGQCLVCDMYSLKHDHTHDPIGYSVKIDVIVRKGLSGSFQGLRDI